MPIYDYLCTACGHLMEVIHGIHGHGPERCPVCGGAMRKTFVVPTVHFKGSGWAKKDRGAAATTKAAAKAKSADAAGGSAGSATTTGGDGAASGSTGPGSSDASSSGGSSASSGAASAGTD